MAAGRKSAEEEGHAIVKIDFEFRSKLIKADFQITEKRPAREGQ